jgi:cytochrome c biogenesis protein CcmG/thiol:disulfide interchange protein DsbE
VFATAVALMALLVYGVLAKSPNTTIDDKLARLEATIAPSFELAVLQRGDVGPSLGRRLKPALADGKLALEELRGIPVVLNFWASWCVPCRQEATSLQRAWRQDARPRGVLFLGLDMQDVPRDARSFLREFGIDYLNIRDPSNGIARRYGTTGVPETFFIDAGGRVVGHVIGVATPQQLQDGVAAAQTGRVVSPRNGGAQGQIR